MRRPLTVRWWFRVGLLIVGLMGGYIAMYFMLRTVSLSSSEIVRIDYPESVRLYALSETGASEMNEFGVPLKSTRYAVSVSYVSDWPTWFGWLCRGFYPLERIELTVRGIEVWPELSDEELGDRYKTSRPQ